MAERDDTGLIDELQGQLYRAFLAGDVTVLDRIFADDFTFTDPGGPVFSKARWLEDIASGDLVFDSIEVGVPEFQHLGDRVIVKGEATIQARYTRSDYNGTFHYIGVYTKQPDGWRLTLTSAQRVLRR